MLSVTYRPLVLSVFMLNVSMLSVVMLNVVAPSVALSVTLPSVVAPLTKAVRGQNCPLLYSRKEVYSTSPGANVIKLFTSAIYEFSQ
jgi:hypothetical protein